MRATFWHWVNMGGQVIDNMLTYVSNDIKYCKILLVWVNMGG